MLSASRKTILVAGETNTKYLGVNDKGTQDAFLLEVNKKNGKVKRFEVFGFEFGTNNGALEPGNLDLHLTRDRNAVIMGNTKTKAFGDQQSHNYPYLIERYETIEEFCVDTKKNVTKKTYKTRVEKVASEVQKLDSQKFDINVKKLEMRSKIPCKKVAIEYPSESPTTSPSDSPTTSPSESPTSFPTGFPTDGPTTFLPTMSST